MPLLITIITPTIGSRHLRKLLQSLNDLDGLGNLFEIEHYIAIDHSGIHGIRVNTQLNEVAPRKGISRYVWNIPIHSGTGNYKGHRIYAGISQFVNGEYTLFLDDDNYLHPPHILNFLQGLGVKSQYDWQFSLREIVDSAEGKHICFDQCESLGHLSPVYYDNSGQSYLIDTNCYFIKSEVLKEISPIWNRPAKYNGGDPDRLLGQLLMTRFPKYRCTREHTLAYRVGTGTGCGDGGGGVSPELFLKGNQIVATRFGVKNSDKIWQKPALYLIHFNPTQTQRILQRIYSGKRDAECAFQQWQLNLFDCKEIQDQYVILDAYKARYIPSGSVVWIHMCNPGELPVSILERNDLKKILYTIESPNIRHQAQWNDAGFLSKYFTRVITYWDGVLGLGKEMGRDYQYYPFIHRCDMSNPAYMQLMDGSRKQKEREGREKSVMILLENRPFQESYQINGITLHAQDALRKEAVQEIAKYFPVVCYGDSWKLLDGDKTTCDQSAHQAIQGLKARGSENEPRLRSDLHIRVKETGSRFLDQDKTIDYYQKHYFAIIIENCDAIGYVSEKIYDAWMASCIPIYYGNIDDRLRTFLGEEIPIDKMMIDMRKIGVKNIGDYMSELYVDEIEEMQTLIRQYKERILDRVGIRSYAQLVVETVENAN